MLSDAKKILAIGAHPDDIELSCGGFLAKASLAQKVKMVVVTGNSSSDHNGNAIRDVIEADEEPLRAAARLGVRDIELLGYPDRQVPYSDKLVASLDDIISAYSPDIVLTHFPFDTHQDHVRTGQATVSAARRHNTILLYEPITPSGRGYVAFRPQVYVDISDTIEQKIEALREHKSQYRKYGEEWIEAVKARARFRGFEMGATYAECFELVRMELNL